MKIFEYKKYILGLLVTLAGLIVCVAIVDGISDKNKEVSFPGDFLKEEIGITPRGEYASNTYFDGGLLFDNGYATLLPSFLSEKDGALIGVYDNKYGICVYEEKDIKNISDENVLRDFAEIIPEKVYSGINHSEMNICRDEIGFFGYNVVRYVCGYRTNKISVRKQYEFGMLMAVQTGDDIVYFYVVTTDQNEINDACQYLQDMVSMIFFMGNEETDSTGMKEDVEIVGDYGDVDIDFEYVEVDERDKVGGNKDYGPVPGSSVRLKKKFDESQKECVVTLHWENDVDEMDITVYDKTYDVYIPISEMNIEQHCAKYSFSNNGGSEMDIVFSSNDMIGEVMTSVE